MVVTVRAEARISIGSLSLNPGDYTLVELDGVNQRRVDRGVLTIVDGRETPASPVHVDVQPPPPPA